MEKLNFLHRRRESEDLLRQLELDLETKFLDTPTRMNRVREHKVRVAIRGGKTDDYCVEAYADLMNRIQYNKDHGNGLQQIEKEV
jgi:hypothetical protein